jgi:hypothetical protein
MNTGTSIYDKVTSMLSDLTAHEYDDENWELFLSAIQCIFTDSNISEAKENLEQILPNEVKAQNELLSKAERIDAAQELLENITESVHQSNMPEYKKDIFVRFLEKLNFLDTNFELQVILTEVLNYLN